MLRHRDEVPGGLRDWVAEHCGWRGLPQARAVIELARPRVESPQETRLRLLWVLGAGLRMPEPNRWLYTDSGELLGRADLLAADAGVVGEYDGADHAGARRRSQDHARREAMEAHGLIVLQHAWADLGPQRKEAIQRIKGAHARGVARDRATDRWRVGAAPQWAT